MAAFSSGSRGLQSRCLFGLPRTQVTSLHVAVTENAVYLLPLAHCILYLIAHLCMRREGLNSRQHFTGSTNPDQVSINIQPGYNLDRDIEGLSSQVGRLKQVLHLHLMACTFN